MVTVKRASNFHDLCYLTRIVRSSTRKFMEFARHHYFICVEYHHRDNTPN